MRRTDPTRASAPGKVILLGEHAVVYGRTALAAAIDRCVHVTVARESAPSPSGSADSPVAQALARARELVGIDLDLAFAITSDLPIGVGLGSSAALSVALIRALTVFSGRACDDATVCAQALEIEKIFHGFPSGIDNTVATYGGLLAFTRGAVPRPLIVSSPIPVVVALGHMPRQTQKTVRALRARWEADRDHYESLFDEIDWLSTQGEHAIAAGDLQTLGGLMNANHNLLRRLAVSTDELDHLVALARAEGACGAKLTGGGGGGAIICLGDSARLLAAFTRAGWRAFATELGAQRGVHATDSRESLDRHIDAPA